MFTIFQNIYNLFSQKAYNLCMFDSGGSDRKICCFHCPSYEHACDSQSMCKPILSCFQLCPKPPFKEVYVITGLITTMYNQRATVSCRLQTTVHLQVHMDMQAFLLPSK